MTDTTRAAISAAISEYADEYPGAYLAGIIERDELDEWRDS